jgi:hypothetical protein
MLPYLQPGTWSIYKSDGTGPVLPYHDYHDPIALPRVTVSPRLSYTKLLYNLYCNIFGVVLQGPARLKATARPVSHTLSGLPESVRETD